MGRRPPARRLLSRMPSSPLDRAASAASISKPRPSSSTRTRRDTGLADTSTFACFTPACRATLVREGLLHDPEGGELDLGAEAAIEIGVVKAHVNACLCLETVDLPPERR